MQENPLTQLLGDASEILRYLSESIAVLEDAIEAEHIARRTAKETAQAYQDAETEYMIDIPFDGRNAEQRKLQQEAAVVKARQNGLGRYYQAMNAAKYKAEDAAMALEQASKRYSATKAAADLTAAMLNAAK